jgi:hypothetical protein
MRQAVNRVSRTPANQLNNPRDGDFSWPPGGSASFTVDSCPAILVPFVSSEVTGCGIRPICSIMHPVPFILFELLTNLMRFSNAMVRLRTEVNSMAYDGAITADVLGTEQGESRIVREGAGLHDQDHPGITPGSAGHMEGISRVAGSVAEPARPEPSEVITEIAPEVAPSETEPERPEPSEVITEIAPERYEPSEVITEIAPERYEPSEVITEIAPDRPEPSEVITEIAPDRPEPSEVITEIAPERPEQK